LGNLTHRNSKIYHFEKQFDILKERTISKDLTLGKGAYFDFSTNKAETLNIMNKVKELLYISKIIPG
jgi:hypothetical protein